MADYADIYGKRVKEFTDDPTLTSSYEGQVWYNENSGTLKSVVAIEAWSSGSAMIRTTSTAGANHALGVGIQTAAIYAGGYSPYTNKTEHYNGSGWSSGGNMNLTRITSGFGTSTAAVAAGGITFPGVVGNQAEEYNGTAWTTGNALGTARAYGSGSGILTAGVFFGGSTNGGDNATVGNTEEYDGTSWSEQNDLNSARKMIGAAGKGPQTAALAFGGDIAPITGNTETYDGTSWTEVNNLNTARENLGGAGDQTSALAFGGVTPTASAATESWDGSSWSTTPATLANARASQPTIGTSTSALMVGGPNPSFPGGWVEEYNKSINTFTAAAWASGGNLNTSRSYMAGMGTQNAALAAGGSNPTPAPGRLFTEEYDGGSWTTVNNLAAIGDNWTGCGTQTAAMGCGGYLSPGVSTATQLYDGTNWTTSGTLNTARYNSGTFGIQTSAVTVGGGGASPVGVRLNSTEHFNGSAWTAVPGTLNTARRVVNCFGTQTAGVAVGGNANTGVVANVEEYNGSAWTNATAYPSAKNGMGLSGTLTAGLSFGGFPGYIADTFGYDGTSWSTRPSMATARSFVGAANAGSNVSTAAFGGFTGSLTAATEEFTGEVETVTAKTLTTS